MIRRSMALLMGLAALPLPAALAAQEPRPDELSALVAEARAANPEIEAARRAVAAAAARVPQAGAPPDPVLSTGVMRLPVDFGARTEMMTMFPISLSQRIPLPGTLALGEAMAREAQAAAEQEAAETELAVLTRLKGAYYEAVFAEAALQVLGRNHALLVDLAGVARARYAVGQVPQHDVLRAQTEVSRLDEQTAALRALRSTAWADVNAVLSRPATLPVRTDYPEAVRRLALAEPAAGVFTAAALGGGLAAGFPSLAELQEVAVQGRPRLQAHGHRVRAAEEAVRLAERQRWPDPHVMVEYAYRPAGQGLLSAMVSVELPVFAGRRQRPRVAEAEHELAALELSHHAMVDELRAEVASRYAAALRTREQILLLMDGVIPQARATLESAAATYQAGRIEFAGLLDAQATLFRHEIELARRFADFGRELAELERTVGRELDWSGVR